MKRLKTLLTLAIIFLGFALSLHQAPAQIAAAPLVEVVSATTTPPVAKPIPKAAVKVAHAAAVPIAQMFPQLDMAQPTDSKIATLIDCESKGHSVRIVDTNGKYSYGILQYQRSTWDWWSELSGITGDPMVPADAIRMARWAIPAGYIGHWSCAHKRGLI